jgi:succinate dehydrogenase / fumarate reductase flavoprotein subunit
VEHELREALDKIAALSQRAANVSVEGNRQYNPGWHLALDLRNMLLVSQAVAIAALERQESRGGHTRDDYPMTDPYWGGQNVVIELAAPSGADAGATLSSRRQALPKPPPELAELLEGDH